MTCHASWSARIWLCLLAAAFSQVPCIAAQTAGDGEAATVTLEVDSFEQFDACFRDRHLDLHTEPGSVRLAPTEYVVHDVGDRISRTGFNGQRVGRKVFHLDTLGASKAELHIFGGTGEATLNGKPITFQGDPGWTMATVDAALLKAGDNEVLFRNGFRLAQDMDRVPPENSFLSDDGGKTWRPAAGEFLVHLRLFRHPAQGTITSEVIDLANPTGADVVAALVRVERVSVTARGRAPKGTAIALEGRSGGTARPDGSWTAWVDAARAKPARYVQWRAKLSTEDRERKPVLEGVAVEADVAVIVRLDATVKEFTNHRIVRSSHPYTFQTPSPKLARLREMFKLDEVVASGKTDMERLVLLRNWVRRQWPHNEGSCRRPWDAIDILSAPAGDHGMCVHYGVAFTQCALSLGYNARQVILQHHYVSDVWSNEHGKWVLMDVECVQPEGWDRYGTALYVDKDTGVPLAGLDLHRARARAIAAGSELVDDVVQVMYMTDENGEHKPYERQYGPKEYNNFWHFAYPPRNNYLDQLEPWEVSHGVDYYHSEDYLWWKDDGLELVPEYSGQTNREGDICWTVNQAEVSLTATEHPREVSVLLDTVTPNLRGYLYRLDGGEWQLLPGEGDDPHSRRAAFTWALKRGENTLEVKPQNAFGRDGVVSRAVVVR